MQANEPGLRALLATFVAGNSAALRQLVPLIYPKLRSIARRQLARERPSHTLDSSALVNEAFLTLATRGELAPKDRAHVLAIWAKVMHQVLVDHARARRAKKRGGATRPLSLDEEQAGDATDQRLLELDAALGELAAVDAQAAAVVELRYFGGANEEDIARSLGTSPATVRRRWAFAKAWLRRQLSEDDDGAGG